jgi:glycosyltransferase involved in cell wall biosynthesis
MRPLISVVMPVRNPHARFFREAVQSILAQSVRRLELIICEAPPGRQASSMLRDISDSRVLHCTDLGWRHVIDQRNHGLRVARSNFVALMDADDISEPMRLEVQYDLLCRHSAVHVLGSPIHVIDSNGVRCGYRHFPEEHEDIAAALRSFNPISHPSVMLRRNAVIAAGGYRYRHYPAEDYELWCRLCAAGLRFRNVSEPLLRYRIHPAQVKALAFRDMVRGTVDVKRLHWHGKLRVSEWLRMQGEGVITLLPQSLLFGAFMRLRYGMI